MRLRLWPSVCVFIQDVFEWSKLDKIIVLSMLAPDDMSHPMTAIIMLAIIQYRLYIHNHMFQHDLLLAAVSFIVFQVFGRFEYF